MSKRVITKIEPISFPMKTLDPFLFCVYHLDNYPAGDSKMQAPRRGNGADFNPKAPYRMYHGDMIPGFPQHPHRGFETLTTTLKGTIDHTDSLGNAGRYGDGDLQWVTAGKGIVHGEMFPLRYSEKPNPLKLFQIWLNLPRKDKMADPSFVMHWAEEIPQISTDSDKVNIRVFAGSLEDKVGLKPPPNSYGSKSESELGVWFLELQPGGKYTIPAAKGGKSINRMAYFIEGEHLKLAGEKIPSRSEVVLNAEFEFELDNTESTTVSEVLILQGRPINEPVVQHGPFVMNSQQEIQQAFLDYRQTQFGGWPWPEDAMVFPQSKDRFALINGTETYPPKK